MIMDVEIWVRKTLLHMVLVISFVAIILPLTILAVFIGLAAVFAEWMCDQSFSLLSILAGCHNRVYDLLKGNEVTK